ncbi:rhomboid family intramembrane serine protease [Candidatus Lokiarchaeum ossiferum]|uniref:rhomboid family intramembrane serine protease n=1 Tax=Candidatus Lokiarchaeum ossiferum TaxID=2951803 RepID=UPI00352CE32C
MVKCDTPDCNETLTYLPFKCRYCGGTFCKLHRLPENHDCTFSMNDNPRARTTVASSTTSVPEESYNPAQNNFNTPNYTTPEDTEKQMEREMRDYIRAQERQSMPPPPTRSSRAMGENYSPFISRTNKMQVTYTFMGLSAFFFVLTLFPILEPYILFNALNLFSNILAIPTLVTSMFAPSDIFGLLFAELMLYSIGKSIEMQFGSKFMATIYLACGGLGVLSIVLVQSLGMILSIGRLLDLFLISTQWCAILGMMTFLLHLVGLNREMRMYLYFIPIKLKAKYILYFLIAYSSVFAILGIFFTGISTASYVGQLMGILGGKLMFNKFGRRVVTGIY